MNYWTQLSIDYANQKNYLDDLFRIYPTIPDGIREINQTQWNIVEKYFTEQNNQKLIETLLSFELFPIKDSYVAYLKRDRSAILRNPETINRLAGRLYDLGLEKIYENCSEPKETNRQIGPLFKRWINKGSLGVPLLTTQEFCNTTCNAILNAGDSEMMAWAREKVNYHRNKGLDFVARFNKKYIIGEAKFLTDFGGHQNAQFNDAIDTITDTNITAETVAILDGVLYIPGQNKLFKSLSEQYEQYNILSALVLNEFLYSL